MPYKTGEQHHNTKHSDKLVSQVKSEYMAYIRGRGIEALAKKYDLPFSTVRDWVQYRTRYSAR